MLILEPKIDEKIVLTDKDSGNETTIRMFRRWSGTLSLAFEAPRAVRITREKYQRSAENGR